ncbi:MAG: serine/threonine-protein kinase [Phycisphaerales bacterium]|nr:serine/threonine-protein kinase [Phycisphaerales bacterium]
MLDEDSAAEEDGFLSEPLLGGRFLLSQESGPSVAPLPTIRGYTLEALIGSGSSGLVYRAKAHAPLSRTVAIKVLREGVPEGVIARFTREQHALARLNHPGVAQVYDAGITDEGRLFVAVEFVDGSWITRYADERALDWRARMELMAQVCEAVHAIHATGVMHRDLKPANILVSEGEGRARPKVIDFGASGLVEPDQATQTEGPRLLGTVAYMAPEQLKHAERGDVRMDVFALGIIAHELIAGRHPYGAPGAPLARLVGDLVERPLPELPRSLGADRAALKAVLARATAKDAAQRYASAQHLGDDLRRVLGRVPVEAAPRTARGEIRSILRRYPRTTIAGVMGVLAIVLLAFAFARAAQQSRARAVEMATTVDALAEGVLGEINELGGAHLARERLARLLLERLDSIPNGMRDARIEEQRAQALHSLASVALDRGDAAQALELRQHACATLERAQELAPGSRAIRIALLRSTILIGDAQNTLGRRDEALANYRDVHNGLLSWLADSPDDLGLMDELAWSYERLTPFVRYSDPDEALRLCTERLSLATRLYDRSPDSSICTYGLGCAHLWVAWVHRDRRELTTALEHTRNAIEFLGDALRREPNRVTFSYRMISARQTLADVLKSQRSSDAPEAMQSALALARSVCDANAQSETAWRYLCSTLEQSVVLFEQYGHSDAAAAVREELARHYESPLSDTPPKLP